MPEHGYAGPPLPLRQPPPPPNKPSRQQLDSRRHADAAARLGVRRDPAAGRAQFEASKAQLLASPLLGADPLPPFSPNPGRGQQPPRGAPGADPLLPFSPNPRIDRQQLARAAAQPRPPPGKAQLRGEARCPVAQPRQIAAVAPPEPTARPATMRHLPHDQGPPHEHVPHEQAPPTLAAALSAVAPASTSPRTAAALGRLAQRLEAARIVEEQAAAAAARHSAAAARHAAAAARTQTGALFASSLC